MPQPWPWLHPHRRGIRIITELVINHTSDQHPWFQAARQAPPGSTKRNFYVWSDTDKKFPETRIIFTDTETSNWAWDPVARAYYWHRFFSHQPDLNHNNPQVVKAVIRVMQFWLDRGVNGLRLDAVPYLCVREGTHNENLPETHTVIKQMRAIVDARYQNRMFLAEANQWPEDVRDYFGEGDECHMTYHFPLMPRMYMAIAQEDRHPIVEILHQTPDIPESCQWAIFLRNHDELTLEMVTDRERDYMYQMYAADLRMRLNLGIRRRLAPLMDNDLDKAGQRWFTAKGERIERVELFEHIQWSVNKDNWLLMWIQAHLTDAGLQDYFLPLAITWEKAAEEHPPQMAPGTLAKVRQRARMGVLGDALTDPALGQALIEAMGQNLELPFAQGRLQFSATAVFADLTRDAPLHEMRVPPVAGTNTTLILGRRLFLKVYRYLQHGTNIELEMGRFLTEISPFSHIAPLARLSQLTHRFSEFFWFDGCKVLIFLHARPEKGL
jgi:hypothetical protein